MSDVAASRELGVGVDRTWREDIVPTLQEYIAIPCVSVAFDEHWKHNGYIDAATVLIAEWCRARAIRGLTVDVVEGDGRTPIIVMAIPAFGDADPQAAAALLYGHFDKQPEMSGWSDGRGPWTPTLEGDRLYGRGGADDGYSAFASLAALEALQASGGSHRRCVVLIEAGEESGSPDLPFYVELLESRIGDVDLVICLDSGCLDYERMWVTTSLRGLVALTLTVRVLDEGVHSGDASGIVPSSMRIARMLLDRVESSLTGEVLVPELHCETPSEVVDAARATAAAMPEPAASHFAWSGSTRAMTADGADQLLARTWRPTLSVIGVDGFPPFDRAGNVLRPFTSLKLSFRTPPVVDTLEALAALTARLTEDPPYGATVTIDEVEHSDGWACPAPAPWLAEALHEASLLAFGAPAAAFGEGGSIPFIGMLARRFPAAQFVITGVLGPGSNAHGPNEFLHLPMGRGLTVAMASVLGVHAAQR